MAAVPEEVLTERLRLRQWVPEDFDWYARLMADPAVTRYLGTGEPADRATAWRQLAVWTGHWRLRGFGNWVVELRDGGGAIGRAGPWYPEGWPGLEIGWCIDPAHQGRGYATEAGAVSLRLCWEAIGADRVISLIRPGNAPSIAVATRLGGVVAEERDLMGGPTLIYEYPRP